MFDRTGIINILSDFGLRALTLIDVDKTPLLSVFVMVCITG